MFTTPKFCQAVGLSYREVDYWTRRAVLAPAVGASGSGSQRLYDETEAKVGVVLVSLRRLGAPLDTLAVVAMQLRDQDDWTGGILIESDGRVWRRVADPLPSTLALCWYVDLDQVLATMLVDA